MSNAKHTPGPWVVVHGVPTLVNSGGSGPYRSVAETSCGRKVTEEDIANARLIASAPAMRKALEQSVKVMDDCLADLKHYVSTHGPGPDRRLEAFNAALAAAREVLR